MALSSEYILTLQQINGVGTKTIFKICEHIMDSPLSIKDLLDCLKSTKIKKLESISLSDLIKANNDANRIIEYSNNHNIGVISYYDNVFSENLRKTINEEGKLCYFGIEEI